MRLAWRRRGAQIRRNDKVTSMPKKPNYDFERRERERLKNEKKAARASEKAKAAPADDAAPEESAEAPDAES